MNQVAEALTPDFQWKQLSVHRWEHVLRAGDQVLITLKWRSGSGALAIAQTAEGAWEFNRTSLFDMRATLRSTNSPTAAVFEPDFMGRGNLTFTDGREFKWHNPNFRMTAWQWLTREGTPIMGFEPCPEVSATSPLNVEGYLKLMSPQLEQSVLAAFGWYLILLILHDAQLVSSMRVAA